ncbi:Pentatricopeptide repeat-containing protein [Arachis hypogaea]|nr:Pentatricopeptide repeat-containing protein [Arachis hypogaea]
MYEELQARGLEPNVFTYNALIRGHSLSGNKDRAFNVYKKMMVQGCSPNRQTFAQLPNKC